jgi:transcriptional regulator with XRE-family HTH domain
MWTTVATCQPQIATSFHDCKHGGGRLGLEVRERPVFLPELGSYFKELRKSKGWSLRGAASQAERWNLSPPISYQVLFRLEKGQVKNPEPGVLRAVAKLYGVSYDGIVGKRLTAAYGDDVDTGYDTFVFKELWKAIQSIREIRLSVAEEYLARVGISGTPGDMNAATAPILKEQVQQLVKALRETLASLEGTDETSRALDTLTPEQREVIELWKGIDEKGRAPILFVMRKLAAVGDHVPVPPRDTGARSTPRRRGANRRTKPGTSADPRR